MTDAAPVIPAGAAEQIRASNPNISAFVSANAGSGKTRTLVSRVARLLLAGARPQTLLCVTFTKAAAAEMQRRLFDVLGGWSTLDDDPLRDELAELEGRAPGDYDEAFLSRARALFAAALETPGGLKIQTIHAFCEKLLKRFPVEAGVSPGFKVADDTAAADLAAEARDAVAVQAAFGDTPLAQAYERFSVALAFDAFQDMFRTFESRRGDLGQWIKSVGGVGLRDEIAALAGLEAWTEFQPADEVEVEAGEALTALWSRAALVLSQAGAKGDQDRAAQFQLLVENARGGAVTLAGLLPLFFTEKGEGTPGTWIVKSAALKKHPDLVDALVAEQDRLERERDRLRAARVARDTFDAMILAGAYVEAYGAAKRRRRLLDFADLVQLTVELLTVRTDAAWVLYKLDEGIDHILVDEAQDTAPEQWAVLRQLTEDFFAGAGAGDRPVERTIFVVGDEKQSIFSFQGAAPERLRAENRFYAARASQADRPWHDVPLLESWRSTEAVLRFVDAAFEPVEARAALQPGADAIRHVALRLGQPGCVDLWPLEREPQAGEVEAWDEPLDAAGPGAWRKLAERMAAEIEGLIARGEQIFDRDLKAWRGATPGDVLVLVRKRGPIFEETIRALKRRGVPVAGADRLRLSEHPVFEDVVALLRFLQFPNDDLTLAALLRSPFCDVDEQSLFDLAYDRKGQSLWSVLTARAGERPAWTAARDLFERLRAESGSRTPFDLLSRLFAAADGEGRSMRTRFMTRLGPEAADALDETLAQVLGAEERGARDLESLAHALARLDVEVKREMDQPKREVRVMTAHGAKGLEAPIVFLPETVAAGEPRGTPLLQTPEGGFLWCASSSGDCGASEAAREDRKAKAEAESLRLLYVALTRARDRVVLAGRVNATAKLENLKGWRPVAEAAFASLNAAGKVRRVRIGDLEIERYGDDPKVGDARVLAVAPPAALPAWARRLAPPEPRALRWASPSEMADQARSPAPSPLAQMASGLGRFRRGELIHKLFEMLPDVADEDRRRVAGVYLAGQPDLSDAQREEIAGAVFAVLEDARFAEVFGPGSRAEVALAGAAADLPRGLAISGRLDRLVVTPDRVLVVDYKTNRPAPARAGDADPAYLGQMAAYVAVLRALYPAHRVEAALLWTDGPSLMPIPPDLLATTLAGLAGS